MQKVVVIAHKALIYVMKTCSIRVGHRDNPKRIEAKARRINGVKDAHWNARTREVVVSYDANKTSARYIKRIVA